jgi:hypothetical protein
MAPTTIREEEDHLSLLLQHRSLPFDLLGLLLQLQQTLLFDLTIPDKPKHGASVSHARDKAVIVAIRFTSACSQPRR